VEPVVKETVAVAQIFSGISSSVDFGTHTVKDDNDNASFPSLSGSTSSAFSNLSCLFHYLNHPSCASLVHLQAIDHLHLQRLL
jgi:hypothetical protein